MKFFKPNLIHQLIIGLAVVLTMSTPAWAQTDLSEIYQPRVLPGQRFYFAKRGWERFQLAVTFGNERKLALHQKMASKRLAEAGQLIKQGKNDDSLTLALSTYQQELKIVTDGWSKRMNEENVNIPIAALESLKNMAASHQPTLLEYSLKVNPNFEADIIKAIEAPQVAADLTVDASGLKPLPPEFVEKIAQYSAIDVLSDSEVQQILEIETRVEARKLISTFIEQGKLSIDDAYLINAEDIERVDESRAEKMKAVVGYKALKNVTALPFIANPPAEVETKITEFMANYQPGTPIPDDPELRKYLVPQIKALELAAEAPYLLPRLNAVSFRPTDQKIYSEIMKSIKNVLGDKLPDPKIDQPLPIDQSVARQLYSKFQESCAEYTGFKEFAQLKEQIGEQAAKKQFFEKRNHEFSQYFDPSAFPPGWDKKDWSNQLDHAKKVFYGVDVKLTVAEQPVTFRGTPGDWARPPENFVPYDPEKMKQEKTKIEQKWFDVQQKYEDERKMHFDRYAEQREKHYEGKDGQRADGREPDDEKWWQAEKQHRQKEFELIDHARAPTEQERKIYEEKKQQLIQDQHQQQVNDHQDSQNEGQKHYQQYQAQPHVPQTYPTQEGGAGSSSSSGPTTTPTSQSTSPATTTTQPTYSQPTTSSPTSTTTDPTHTTPSSGTTTTSPSTTTTSPTPTTTSPTPTYTQPTDSSSGTSSGTTTPSSGTTTSPTSPTTSPTSGTTSPSPSPTPTYTDKEAECRQHLGLVGVYPLTETQYSQLNSCMGGH